MLSYTNQINNYDEVRRVVPKEFDDIANFVQQSIKDEGLCSIVQEIDFNLLDGTNDQLTQFNETPGPIYWDNNSSSFSSSDSQLTTPALIEDMNDFESYFQEDYKYKNYTSHLIKEEAPTNCLVCGFPTNNFHYDVSSCNGCKTFFRRCVVLSKFYKCKLNKQCDIRHNIEGNPCKGCRLAQCVVIGMNATAIQFPKNADVEKILQKFDDFKQTILPQYMPIAVTSPEETIVKELNELLYIENKVKRIRESTYIPDQYQNAKIRDILAEPRVVLSHADKFEKPKEWPLSFGEFKARLERKIEAIIKSKITEIPLDQLKEEDIHKKFWIVTDNILVIDSAKTLPFFKLLGIDDQEMLLKHIALVNATLMQGFYSFMNNYHTIVMPDGSIPFQFGKIKREVIEKKQQNGEIVNGILLTDSVQKEVISNDKDAMADLKRFIESRNYEKSFEPLEELFSSAIQPIKRVNITEKEYVLVKALIFCYNALPDLSPHAREILQNEANKYSQLLLKYLQLEYGELKGATKYAELISLIAVFFNIAEKHRQLYLLQKIIRESWPKRKKCGDKKKTFFNSDILHEVMHAI